MALENFSPSGNIVIVNGRQIENWGEQSPPYDDSQIDPKNSLKRGVRGRAIKSTRINNGRTVNLYLMPGSPESAFLQGLYESGATITMSRVQIGTLEKSIGTEGVIVSDGTTGRGGSDASSNSDDQFTIEFNLWNSLKGGES